MMDYFLFDLDGTITTEELLPRIAKAIGVEKQIAELTERTIAGEIPFEYSLRHRVEILSIAPVSQVQKIVASVALNPHIIDFIHKNKERCAVVTGNLNAWIQDLFPILKVPVISSVVEVINDKISHFIEVLDKKKAAQSFKGRICAVGDGANDFGMLEHAEVAIAYGGIHKPARQLFDVASHAIYDGGVLCRFLSQL